MIAFRVSGTVFPHSEDRVRHVACAQETLACEREGTWASRGDLVTDTR